MNIQLVRGMKDLLPEESLVWQWVEENARKLFHRYGYREIRTPVLEQTMLFSRGVGEATDIVEKEMYTFADSDGETLSLRPEGTAPVVRAFIAQGGTVTNPEWKVFYIGPMFRRERPQKGRYRQFHQIGIEVFGIESPIADAEQLKILSELTSVLGIKGTHFAVNSLGCPVCRPVYREKLLAYLSPHKDELCENCKRRLTTNPLRVLDCKEEQCKSVAKGAPILLDNLCGDCNTHFEGFKKALADFGLKLDRDYHIDPMIVRGLDYYTRTAFEVLVKDERLGSQNAVAGGGRYDGLVETLGGKHTPAVGWALGVERLISLIPEEMLSKPSRGIFIVAGENEKSAAVSLLDNLRKEFMGAKFPVECSFDAKSFKAQMKHANRVNAAVVIIIGEEEAKKGTYSLKLLDEGTQNEYNYKNIVEKLREFFKM